MIRRRMPVSLRRANYNQDGLAAGSCNFCTPALDKDELHERAVYIFRIGDPGIAIGFCKNSALGDVEQVIYGLITLIGTLAWRAACDRY